MNTIVLSTESTSDLPKDIIKENNIEVIPLHVNLDGIDYKDGIDLESDLIYKVYEEKKLLPTTSAPNVAEYISLFEKYPQDKFDIIHISLGSGISSSYQNARLASMEFNNVKVIDSGNLSIGVSLLIMECLDLIKSKKTLDEIVENLENLKNNINTSFIINKLTYLAAGGRCSSLAAFGANVFQLKPEILVDNKDAKMKVGKKYRGSLSTVLRKYIKEKLEEQNYDPKRIFVANAGMDKEYYDIAMSALKEFGNFESIVETKTGATISSHCGYNTLGISFINK